MASPSADTVPVTTGDRPERVSVFVARSSEAVAAVKV
jgi:hypothetical protein